MLGIPLLGVQTDNDSLTQEEGRPHDYVPDGTFPLVMQNEVENHCKRVRIEDQDVRVFFTQQNDNDIYKKAELNFEAYLHD